jgi:toxin ParE1/3/4
VKLRFTRRSLRHLEEVRAYIGLQDPHAANRVVARIGQAIESLALHPQRGRPGRITGTRELVISGTAYIVPYRITGDSIEILAVMHGARLWPRSGG